MPQQSITDSDWFVHYPRRELGQARGEYVHLVVVADIVDRSRFLGLPLEVVNRDTLERISKTLDEEGRRRYWHEIVDAILAEAGRQLPKGTQDQGGGHND